MESDLLFDAIEKNEIEKLEAMLSNGYDVNTGDKDNYTLLHMAIDFGNENAAKLLLSTEGCEVNCFTNFHELTPIHFAAQDGRTNLVILLLDYGANIDSVNSTNCTPLYFAVCGNHIETVKVLLSRGANVNIRDANHISPLLQAVSINKTLTKLLLDNNAEMSDYCRELHTALISNKAEIANIILDRLKGPLSPNRIGRSPLQNAVAHINVLIDFEESVNLAKKLVRLGDDVNYSNQYGTVFHILIQRSAFLNNGIQDLSAQALFKYFLSLPDSDFNKMITINGSGTPLTLAFKLNQYFFAESLIRAGADVKKCSLDEFRYTRNADLALKLLFNCGYRFEDSFTSRSRPLNDEDLPYFEQFCDWLKNESSKIMNLRHLIRIAFRKFYGSKINTIVSKLQCPEMLRLFILFDMRSNEPIN